MIGPVAHRKPVIAGATGLSELSTWYLCGNAAIGYATGDSHNQMLMMNGTPPSLFSGRGGRCGVQTFSEPSFVLNSGRPSRSNASKNPRPRPNRRRSPR